MITGEGGREESEEREETERERGRNSTGWEDPQKSLFWLLLRNENDLTALLTWLSASSLRNETLRII